MMGSKAVCSNKIGILVMAMLLNIVQSDPIIEHSISGLRQQITFKVHMEDNNNTSNFNETFYNLGNYPIDNDKYTFIKYSYKSLGSPASGAYLVVYMELLEPMLPLKYLDKKFDFHVTIRDTASTVFTTSENITLPFGEKAVVGAFVIGRYNTQYYELTAECLTQLPCKTTTSEHDIFKDLQDELKSENSTADIQVVYGQNKTRKAHKLVLKSQSNIFKELCNTGLANDYLIMEEVDDPTLDQLFNWFYTGKLPESNHTELLKCADKYGLNKLKDICEDELYDSITKDNAEKYLESACEGNSDRLAYAAYKYCKENLDEFKVDQIKETYPEAYLRIIERFARDNNFI